MKKKVLTRKELVQRIAVVGTVVLILLAGLLVIHFWETRHSLFPDSGKEPSSGIVEYEGRQYELRKNVETVLVMGLDKVSSDIRHDSYNNDQQADFLMLLVVDHGQKTCSAIHINRDTMADITVLGIGGKKVGTVTQQIALAHTYGSGAQDSCRNTVRAVSAHLDDVHIDYYVSLTMDAVGVVNDFVGGVTVEILEDLTLYDEALREGETVTLMGDQALYYVRHRYGLEDATNTARMERQQQYLNALYQKASAKAEAEASFREDLALALADRMITDCSASGAEALFSAVSGYEFSGFYRVEGELTVGEHMEFYADEESITELVLHLFYQVKD